jgi:hypothetical protein
MKILICSKLFYPSNRIGAVRPSNFAKYLAEFGHDVTVVTERNNNNEDFTLPGVEIIRISNSTMVQKMIDKNNKRVKANKEKSINVSTNNKKSSNKSIKSKFKQLILKNRSQVFALLVEYDWYKSAKQIIKRQYKKNSFDVVISSFGPLSSFLLGKSVSKLRLANYWISDFRDNMVFDGYPGWLNKLSSNFEKTAIKRAHAITFVSRGQKEIFLNNNNISKNQANKIHVVFNGYEKIISENQSIKKEDKILKIAYTGQLYSGVRDFSLLFHVLDDLIKEDKIDSNKIQIVYAGQNSNELNLQINKFKHIEKICTDYGFVSREKALEIQKVSDILVALTWNTHKEQGILTGKFLEYLQAQKPIISLTSGNLPNGELTQMVQNLKLGIACEYINYKEDYIKLKTYIQKQYNLRIENKELDFNPDYSKISEFHYAKITKQLMIIINSLSRKV